MVRMLCTVLLILGPFCVLADGNRHVDVWAVDPLLKVFKDAKPPPTRGAAEAEVARGEVATLQIAVRAEKAISRPFATRVVSCWNS